MTFKLGEVAAIPVQRAAIRDCGKKIHHDTPVQAVAHIDSLYSQGRAER
jgi:hypothetical protein